jgi:hypothetical protein
MGDPVRIDPADIDDRPAAELDEQNVLSEVGDYAIAFVDHCREIWGDDVQLQEIIIVGEVLLEDDDEKLFTEVVSLSSEDRAYVTKAILEKAAENAVTNKLIEHSED